MMSIKKGYWNSNALANPAMRSRDDSYSIVKLGNGESWDIDSAMTNIENSGSNKIHICTLNKDTYTDAAIDTLLENFGATLELTIDSSTFVITAILKNKDGTTLGTPQTIDLPLESVVVSGSYDNATKSLILTLENGNTITIPIADLISGLQEEITVDNKLDADLVDDSTSTNKFVTSAEKTNWNNHIANTGNPHSVTKAQVGLGNVDNTSDLNKPISTATQNALNLKADKTTTYTKTETDILLSGKQDNISDLAAIRSNAQAGKAASDTIATYGNIVTHNVSEFATAAQGAKADTAVQPADLATVATTGSYNDLTDTPVIPSMSNRVNGAPLSNLASVFYGTSSTAAATVEKVVSIPSITTLDVGTVIVVQPTVTSTVANSTIKLNNFSAYPMRYNNTAITTSTDSIVWNAAYPSVWVFDGTYWRFVAHGIDTDTTYGSMSVSEGTTGTATSNRVVRANYLKQIIQGTTLTGIDVATTGAVTATDTITDGIGKLQATKANIADLATVATSGSYNDLSNKPTIPAAQVNSDWNANSGVAQILNKPTLATVATSGSYNDLSNKPTIPTVGNGTITIKQGGVTKGSFTLNQATGDTIALDTGGGSGALVVGQMLEVVGTADYTPEGCLLADGAEYTKAQFPDLWANFLTGTPKLQTCTYTEYANQIAEYGFCNKFAVDTTNETFKVPTRNKYRKLVKKIVNGTSWANIYDDGWVEQGGRNNGLNEIATIQLPINMKDLSYTVQITRLVVTTADDQASISLQARNLSLSSFQVRQTYATSNGGGTGSGNSYAYCWQVSGYTTIPDSTANITREFVVVANGTLNQEQMDWSAWASSLAGKANIDLSNTPANVDYVIESQEPTSANGYTWYRKYKSGWVEQGGGIANNSTTTTVTLPVAMANTNYTLVGGLLNGKASTNFEHMNFNTLTTTSFNFTTYDSYGVRWQVSGMAA